MSVCDVIRVIDVPEVDTQGCVLDVVIDEESKSGGCRNVTHIGGTGEGVPKEMPPYEIL